MNWGDSRLPDRFWDKVIPEPNSGCWLWVAACTADGYGTFTVDGHRKVAAHRAAFFAPEAPPKHTADALQLDHLCRVRCCVNPTHLELVTSRENSLRGIGFAAVNGLKETCLRGHRFAEYGYLWRGSRHCLRCRHERQRERRGSKRTWGRFS